MTNPPVRVAIIGCGVIAPVHLNAFCALQGVAVRWLCDAQIDAARALAAKAPAQQPPPNTCADFQSVLADPSVDLVAICTDHASHVPIATAALQAGKSILLEKPMAISHPDLQALLDCAREAQSMAAAVLQHRFDHAFVQARAAIASGQLGTLLAVNGRHACWRPHAYYTDSPWRGTRQFEGGSLLINQSIHYIDILQWVAGGARSVFAHTANRAHPDSIETEDAAALLIELQCGCAATFSATSASHFCDWHSRLEWIGTDGRICITNDNICEVEHADPQQQAALAAALAPPSQSASEHSVGKSYYGSSHHALIADAIDAHRLHRLPIVSVANAAHVNDIVLCAYASHQSQQPVSLRFFES